MNELPLSDRPRERLARMGVAALGDAELLALVLGSGTRRRGALAVAQAVLAAAGGASGLLQVSVDELRQVEGVGAVRAARLLAAAELGRRALVARVDERPRFRSPQDIARYLLPLHGGHREERCGVVLLDARYRLIRTTVLSVGTQDAALIQPRDIFRVALLASATSVVVFHNHPSGDPEPSPADVQVTARLAQAGDMVGIKLIDHIILGAGRYYSFKSQGEVPR